MVAINGLRIEKFIHGLTNLMFSTIASLVSKMTYVEVVNVALQIELGTKERRASKESTKKLKMRGSFSGGSSSGGR